VESGGVSVLCDPWFSPAYFASWFPFPDNAFLDPEAIGHPTYLYVSHLHKDHFDPEYLARHVDKNTTVLLPEFPLDELRREFEALGFTRFVQTTDGAPVDLDGIRVAICTATTPADGPLGDSTIAIDDGAVRILNQNDCRPPDIDLLKALGPYDLQLLQYSGAIWYPMTYRLDPETADRLGRQKRANQLARATRYITEIGAAHVIPCAGPPAFLDDDLFDLNDFDDDPANIFVDQPAFLRYLAERDVHTAVLMVTGSRATLGPAGHFEIEHPGGDAHPDRIFSDKKAYLRAFQERRRPQFEVVHHLVAGSSADDHDLVESLAEWIEPLLAGADRVCEHLGGSIVIDLGSFGVVIDPATRQVREWKGEEWEHLFAVAPGLIRWLVERRTVDWVNELFLSCRFEAERTGGYNGTVFSFFKCLSPERMAYLEASLSTTRRAATRRLTDADKASPGETWRCGDYLVERRCPHLGGDLSRFGEVDGGVLTCTLHGWRFELATGRCLTAERAGLGTEWVGAAAHPPTPSK